MSLLLPRLSISLRMLTEFALWLTLSLLLAGHAPSAGAQDLVAVPALTGHVVDQSQLLQQSQRQALEQVLSEYEARSGSQIAILLISSTAPEAIEQYSIRVADAWKLGRKGIDDGVILIVAKDNSKALRRLRIEAGRGVQGSLTDAKSKQILQDVIAPYFRKDDYYGGLTAGVAAVTTLLDAEQLPAPEKNKTNASGNTENDDAVTNVVAVVIFLVFFFAVIALSRLRQRNALHSNEWGNTAGVILGALLDHASRGGHGGGRSGGGMGGIGGDGGFSGGGGGFDGGGASGDW